MGDFFLPPCVIMHKLGLRVAASVARSGQRYSRSAALTGVSSRVVSNPSTRCFASMKTGSDTNVNAAVNPEPEMNPKDQMNVEPKVVESNPVAEEAVGVAEEATPTETQAEETEGAVKDKMEKTEKVIGPSSQHQFQAETRKLLDIVAKSLYTDKEIFIRELVSNASDAMEKFRHAQVAGDALIDPYLEPEIHITADNESNTIIIQDFGIGMTDQELMDNLGTIARSGTLEFVKNKENAQSFIGQFGVGFYSSFMVADQVEVYSRSAHEGSKGYLWKSDGSGSYELAEADNVTRGTKIILHLREDCKEFSGEKVLKDILSKHSNFVNFKILLNGQRINTIDAIWMLPKNEVTEEQHNEFYKFISHSYDKPRMKLHFQTDSPLNLSSIFYVPSEHTEKYGIGRMEPGVSLYCRKILIQSNMKKFLPDYLRFIRGVVDCEDISLNISREHLQDSQLVNRLASVLTRRIIKFFGEEAKRNPGDFEDFFNEYGQFIKEGIVSEQNDRENLAKLLRMESSKFEDGKLVSFEDYISRMGEEQKEIYYAVAQKRSLAEGSPYMEHFKKKGIEVLFMYQAVDDWVMNAIGTFKGKSLKPIESAEIEKEEEENITEEERADIKSFNDWIREQLSDKISSVKDTSRLTDSPAVIIDHETVAYRRMMQQVDPKRMPKLPKQALEINVKHPVMANLRQIREINPALAAQAIEQVYDNAMISAGLLSDNRPMLDRINSLLARTLQHELDDNQKKE